MGRPKDDTKREAIFEASLQLVLKEGFSGFKMSEVAKAAHIATGTLYIYFKNKVELINELYISVKRQSVDALVEDYDPKAPFMVCFEKMWYNYLNYSLQRPEEAAFVEQYYRSVFLKQEVVEETDRLLLPIFELLERGKTIHLVNHFPTELLVSQLIGGINEIVRWSLMGRLNLTEEVKRNAFDMAWNSIKR